jgi:hypothetical protein
MKPLLFSLVLFYFINSSSCLTTKIVTSECTSKTLRIDCGDPNKVAVIYNAIYGVRKKNNGNCKYT